MRGVAQGGEQARVLQSEGSVRVVLRTERDKTVPRIGNDSVMLLGKASSLSICNARLGARSSDQTFQTEGVGKTPVDPHARVGRDLVARIVVKNLRHGVVAVTSLRDHRKLRNTFGTLSQKRVGRALRALRLDMVDGVATSRDLQAFFKSARNQVQRQIDARHRGDVRHEAKGGDERSSARVQLFLAFQQKTLPFLRRLA